MCNLSLVFRYSLIFGVQILLNRQLLYALIKQNLE